MTFYMGLAIITGIETEYRKVTNGLNSGKRRSLKPVSIVFKVLEDIHIYQFLLYTLKAGKQCRNHNIKT